MADATGGLGGLGGYVSNLYSDLFGRLGAPDEVSYWANSGQDPSSILDSFLNSQEFRQTALPLMYQNELGRAPDQAGLDYYLNSNMSLDNIDAALGGSQEAKDYLSRLPPDYVSTTDPWQMQGPDMPIWLKPFDFGDAKTPLDQTIAWYRSLLGDNAASGAGGNFATESGINPTQPQTRTGRPDGTPYLDKNGNYTGYGLSQLGGYRLNGPDPNNKSMGLNDFAQRFGLDPSTTETQLRHQYYEMQDGWLKNQNLLEKLRNAKSPTEAMGIFGGPTGYERPRDPVVPGTKNWTERARNAEIINQYMKGGLDGLSPDQKSTLMEWMSRTNPIPSVNPNIDTQKLGPNIDLSSLDISTLPPIQTAGGLPNNPLSGMPLNLTTDPSTALLGNPQTNPFTGNPVVQSTPVTDLSQWLAQLGINSPGFTTTSFSSGGSQQPSPANPMPSGIGGSNTPFLSPNLYPQTQPLPFMDFSSPPTFNPGGFSGVGV